MSFSDRVRLQDPVPHPRSSSPFSGEPGFPKSSCPTDFAAGAIGPTALDGVREKRLVQQPTANPCPDLRRTFVGAAWLSFQPIILNAVSVPVLAYIIHRLGPEAYGQWMIATALIAACMMLPNLGLRGAFVRAAASRPEGLEVALGEQLGLRITLGALAVGVAIGCCLLLGYPGTVLACVAISAAGLLLTTVASTLSDALQAKHRLRTIASVNMASGLLLTGVSLPVAMLGGGPAWMATAYLTGPLVATVAFTITVRRMGCLVRVRWSIAAFRRLLHGCRHFAAQQVLAACSTHAESLLLPRLAGIAELGFFTAGALMATRLTAFSDGLSTAAYPAMSRQFADGNRHGGATVVRYVGVAFISGLLLAILAAVVAGPLGRLLFPTQPELFIDVALITVWSLPIVGVEFILSGALNAAGEDAAQAKAGVPSAATSLAAAVLLVSAFGAIGAAWSLLLRPAIRCLFLAPLCVRTFRRNHAALVHGGLTP